VAVAPPSARHADESSPSKYPTLPHPSGAVRYGTVGSPVVYDGEEVTSNYSFALN
jgi:hypothetical protein